MNVPENPYRKALAVEYMKNCLGKPNEELIKKAVNGDENDVSLDYYIGVERMINHAIHILRETIGEKHVKEGWLLSAMLFYVSYEIERLTTFKNDE